MPWNVDYHDAWFALAHQAQSDHFRTLIVQKVVEPMTFDEFR
jgi:hypothetical protein